MPLHGQLYDVLIISMLDIGIFNLPNVFNLPEHLTC